MLLLLGKAVSPLHTSTHVETHKSAKVASLLRLIPTSWIPRRCQTTAEEPIRGGLPA